MCGERSRSGLRRSSLRGSSPRVRGTRPGWIRPRTLLRFIPACAGNAIGATRNCVGASVHPRVCGERLMSLSAATPRLGSSPRVRGTRDAGRRPVEADRFIPACAGNAERGALIKIDRPVHPRVCGERATICFRSNSASGSSPRVRGTLAAWAGMTARDRFIPACAGNAGEATLRTSTDSVHPRVCGERKNLTIGGLFHNGSSPRVRGTRAGRHVEPQHHRFIPACAGNAFRWQCGSGRDAVHPRVCGERAAGNDNAP